MTPAQVQEARKLLDWSRDRLSGLSGVSSNAIRVFEMTGRIVEQAPGALHKGATVNLQTAVRATLEQAGIEFTNQGSSGPGVRLRHRAAS